MISVQRRFEIDSGHRVLHHESKCAHPHGHRYAIVVTACAAKSLDSAASELDALGRVIDFAVIKELLGAWLNEHWDHAFIVYDADKTLCNFLEANSFRKYVLPMNPTAENMANYLLHSVCPKLFAATRVQITEVCIHETPNCAAKATLGSAF